MHCKNTVQLNMYNRNFLKLKCVSELHLDRHPGHGDIWVSSVICHSYSAVTDNLSDSEK